jgi:hypothetical protein
MGSHVFPHWMVAWLITCTHGGADTISYPGAHGTTALTFEMCAACIHGELNCYEAAYRVQQK